MEQYRPEWINQGRAPFRQTPLATEWLTGTLLLARELALASSSALGSDPWSHLGFYMRFTLVNSCSTEFRRLNYPGRWSNIAPNAG